LDQVIDNIQIEPSEFIKLVVPIAKPTQLVVGAIKSPQLVQTIIELVQIENP